MRWKKLGSFAAKGLALGCAAAIGTIGIGASVASADPAFEAYPHFNNGNVAADRDSGSDTTFFMMQKIGDLYNTAALYGCTLNTSSGQTLFNSGDTSETTNEEYYCQKNADISTTDDTDNWSRDEISEGVDDVGSGAGQNQLCDALSAPLPVDFARSSKPSAAISGCNEVETGYAKDAAPVVAFPSVNPSTFGTSTFSTYAAVNGGVIGPVADGWLPGDPVGGPYNGTKFSNVSNVDNGGGANSTAYRLWCASGATRITDWGQLTDLGPKMEVPQVTVSSGSEAISVPSAIGFDSAIVAGDAVSGAGIAGGTTVSAVNSATSITLSADATASSSDATLTFTVTPVAEGQGQPYGMPVRIVGVNTASGTEATLQSYAESGVSGGGCSSNVDPNAANDPAVPSSAAHIALENNATQIGQFAAGDFPSDNVDQAIEVATSIYFESNGVFNTDPFAGQTEVGANTYAATKVEENGFNPTTPTILQDTYPTARTLFNIYSANTVKASVGGFLNWICDSNTAFTKGEDNTTGKNYDQEITTIINTTFGFIRLTDTSTNASTNTPPDNVVGGGVNNSCAAQQTVATTEGSNTVSLVGGGNFPTAISAGWAVSSPDFASGTTVTANNGTTLTLSSNASATDSSANNLVFPGEPAVLAVSNLNS